MQFLFSFDFCAGRALQKMTLEYPFPELGLCTLSAYL
jgi:hypothetical protein